MRQQSAALAKDGRLSYRSADNLHCVATSPPDLVLRTKSWRFFALFFANLE